MGEHTAQRASTAPARASLARPVAIMLVALLVIWGSVAGFVAWRRSIARDEQRALAAAAFAPVVDALARGGAAPEAAYDIDATIRALHEMELALAHGGDPQAWLGPLAQQDYRRVPRDVLDARADLLRVLQRMYTLQTEEKSRAEYARFVTALVAQTASSFSASAHATGGGVAFDGARLRGVVNDLKTAYVREIELQQAIAEVQGDLVAALHRNAQTTWRYVDEWDRLNLLRDRAYLAIDAGRWEEARAAAEEAVRRAPFDREAHLLLAWSGLELAGRASSSSSSPAPVEGPSPSISPEALLRAYLNDHPGETAPAFLLLGLLEERRGRPDEARLHYEQAAAYYPRQAERLQDLLDPYRARSFLRKSREGNHVLGLYRSMMAGAGAFSPDLRLAALAYLDGDDARGRAKVLDHFSRRRADRAWSVLLPDVRFAERTLGPHFDRLFPEETFLDLVADRTLFRDKLGVKIDNRSDRTLHNATLVLCVHLTDMHPDDCEAVAPPTQPVVPPHATTDFESLAIDVDVGGVRKTVADVVAVRAVLIADETVAWVDTAQARIDAARALHAEPTPSPASQASPGVVEQERVTWQRVTGLSPDVVERLVRTGLVAAVDKGLGADEVTLRLPRELAILHPSIRLRYRGREFASATSDVDEDVIRIRFDDVGDFDDLATSREMTIDIASRFLTVTASLGAGPEGTLALRDVRLAQGR